MSSQYFDCIQFGDGLDVSEVSGSPGTIRVDASGGGGGGGGPGTLQTWNMPGPIATLTGVARWYPVADGSLTTVHCAVVTTGSGTEFDILKNGASIGSVTLSGATGTVTLSDSDFVIGDYYTVDVVTVGSGSPTDAVVQFVGSYA